MKRLFDIFISLLLLILLLPIFIVVAFFIKIEGGPVFYSQVRIGKNGELFNIYKFRSMVINASELGGYSTGKNDNRITTIGKFIRKTSIDELPQLINVIKGNMSLVGPRPNVPLQKAEYSQDDWERRNSVLPGITGLAQATLRSNATPEERLNLDLNYIQKFSFLFDLKIIVLTVKQVLFKGGN